MVLTLFNYCILTMGIGESKDTKLAVEEDSELVKINHERFANREIVRSEDEEESILIKVAVPSEKQYNAWKEEVGKVTNQEVLLLPKSHSFHREGFCGSSGYAEIVYENYPFILSDEIHNRECLSTKYFEQNQLWYLAYTLLSAAQQFHASGKKVGDIRPLNIFISQDGSVKLACSSSWPLQKSNYEKSFEKEVTYLSPEEVIDLGYGKTESNTDLEVSETFSIGLTLLDAALLSDSTDLYKNFKQIDYEALEARLKELENRTYSNPLAQLIKNMCEVNPQNRTKASELLEWLQPYEASINSFSEFQPEVLPSKFAGKTSTLPNQSDYSNLYNPQPYSSAYNPNSAYVTSNPPPQQATNAATYYTVGNPTTNKGLEFGSSYPIGSYTFQVPTIPQSQPYVNPPTLLPASVIQSSYVPFKSNFSLSKIDQQLQQSRKLFPS